MAQADAVDGVAPLNEDALLRVSEPGRHLMAGPRDIGWTGPVQPLLGYGHTDGRTCELVVLPSARRQGHGRMLATALLAAADGSASLWAHGSLPGTAQLGASLGLVPVRELVLMGRDLADLPAAVLPDGVTLRSFEVGRDEAAWLALNAAAFADHPEQGSWSADDLAKRLQTSWFEPADLLLAEREGELVASHWTKLTGRDEPGEVYVVAVAPAAQGGGLGSAILLAGLEHLQQRGAQRVVLYVEADNAAALHVYARWGFSTLSSDTAWARPADVT